MFLRKLTRLGAELLGMFLPRSGANVDASAQADLDRAAALEAANARIRELEAMREEEITQRANERLHEIFPNISAPDPNDRRPIRSATEVTPGADQPPSIEDQVAELDARVESLATERAVDELEAQLNRAVAKYPMASRDRVLMWIAEAGDQPINVEKMVEISHKHESRVFDERYNARRAAEANNTRENVPPRMPTNPGGVHVETPKITSATASRTFVELARKKLAHWFPGG